MISVHRGLWGPAPENSRRAIRDGAAFGIVEIDVQLAAEGVPVVMHDASLDRMTGDPRSVSGVASGEIAGMALRQGAGGRGAAMTDETVPTLEQAIHDAPPGTFFDFDVKLAPEVEPVAAYLAENGLTEHGSLKIDVFSEEDIRTLRDLEKRFGIMVMAKLVLQKESFALVPALVEAGAAAAEVWFDDLDVLARAAGIAGGSMAITSFTLDPVHCCGLTDAKALDDPDAVWGRLLGAGVTVLMTDRAPALDAYLRRSGA